MSPYSGYTAARVASARDPLHVRQFSIAGSPPSLNEWTRAHWRHRAAINAAWLTRVKLFAMQARVEPLLGVPVIVTLTIWQKRSADPDNHVKFILDGLVRAKLIRDDRYPDLFELRLRNRVLEPGENDPYVEVFIETAIAGRSGIVDDPSFDDACLRIAKSASRRQK